jgi:HD-GYP domain-containing protein (c-di-GMP phosphodiesterase class II)
MGVPAGDLPLQARILATADIFEALTASDRGYRKPMPLSTALTIMGRMCNEGHLDPKLFELVLDHQVYTDYAHKHLKPDQVDEVDIRKVKSLFL